MRVVTDFGDITVLLPLAAVMLIWLMGARSTGGAAWWLAALALCVGGTALLKIYFFACPASDLASPSGHGSFSALVYGALAVIVAAELTTGWRRMIAMAGGAALIATIAVSRFALGAHSLPEIVLGIGVGLASLALFAQGYLRCRPAGGSLTSLLVAVVVLVAVLHGRELRAEEFLQALSQYFRVGAIACGGA
jgi:membrane-associated phospholipid phosphatase